MSCFEHDQSRRAFLKRGSVLGLAGVAAPFATTMGAIGEAAAATASDYKALVCVFLYGGNDYANTLSPTIRPATRSTRPRGRTSRSAARRSTRPRSPRRTRSAVGNMRWPRRSRRCCRSSTPASWPRC
jgi:uncharacterized protein (DUF1501 family)